MLFLLMLSVLTWDGTLVLKNGKKMDYIGEYVIQEGFVAFTSPRGDKYRFPQGAVDFEATKKVSEGQTSKPKKKPGLVIGDEQVSGVSTDDQRWRESRQRARHNRERNSRNYKAEWAQAAVELKQVLRKEIQKRYRELNSAESKLSRQVADLSKEVARLESSQSLKLILDEDQADRNHIDRIEAKQNELNRLKGQLYQIQNEKEKLKRDALTMGIRLID